MGSVGSTGSTGSTSSNVCTSSTGRIPRAPWVPRVPWVHGSKGSTGTDSTGSRGSTVGVPDLGGREMLHQAQAQRLKPNCMAVGNTVKYLILDNIFYFKTLLYIISFLYYTIIIQLLKFYPKPNYQLSIC